MERLLTSGNIKLRARASILALWIYRKQFHGDMTRAAVEFAAGCEKLMTLVKNPDAETLAGELMTLANEAQRLIWAMAKAQAEYDMKRIMPWPEWIEAYGNMDFAPLIPDLLHLLVEGYYSDVKPKSKSGEKKKSDDLDDNVIIAGCKYMNLTDREMNSLTMRGYIELSNAYAGEQGESEKAAGQEDINGFF